MLLKQKLPPDPPLEHSHYLIAQGAIIHLDVRGSLLSRASLTLFRGSGVIMVIAPQLFSQPQLCTIKASLGLGD